MKSILYGLGYAFFFHGVFTCKSTKICQLIAFIVSMYLHTWCSIVACFAYVQCIQVTNSRDHSGQLITLKFSTLVCRDLLHGTHVNVNQASYATEYQISQVFCDFIEVLLRCLALYRTD